MDRIRNKTPHIAVIGDLMIDPYIWSSCEHISPEAPVQVVNIINNLLSLGSDVADEVVLIDFVEGQSRTSMICKINGEG